uniref:Putative secreted protein n=1 Tax=Ixodes ricinus TaxID=34613 RepID=A0A0K8RJ13_IXORI
MRTRRGWFFIVLSPVGQFSRDRKRLVQTEQPPKSTGESAMASFLYFDEAERKLNAKLLPQLDKIHKLIKLDDDDTASNVAILETLLDDITKQMARTDPLFREVFNRLV